MPRHRVAPPDCAAPRSGQSITLSEDLNLRRRRKALAGEECSGGTKQPRLPRNTGTKGSCLAAAFPTGRASRRRPARATARQERRGEVAAGLGFGSRPVTHGGEGGRARRFVFFPGHSPLDGSIPAETNRIFANGAPTLSTSVVVPGGLPRANPVSAML
jgi:hypothetical protein